VRRTGRIALASGRCSPMQSKEFEIVPLPADCVPSEICEACAGEAIFAHVEQVAAVYCSHSFTGAEMPLGGSWHVTPGIAKSAFKEQLLHRLVAARILRERKGRAN
jgi:hypothetical protein